MKPPPPRRSSKVRMLMQRRDCLLVPFGSEIASSPGASSWTVRMILEHGFVPLVDMRMPYAALQGAVKTCPAMTMLKPAPIIAADAGSNLQLVGLAIQSGFDCVFFSWEDPYQIPQFTEACREAEVYGVIRFFDTSSLADLFFDVALPTRFSSHLAIQHPEKVGPFAQEYRAAGRDRDSEIVFVNSTPQMTATWQRMLWRGCGFTLMPGVVLDNVFGENFPTNNHETIGNAIFQAKKELTTWTGDYQKKG